MDGDKGPLTSATFFTELKNRPKTSHISRNRTQLKQQFALDPEIDPSTKVKHLKQDLKRLQAEYVSMVTRVNDSKKVIDQQYRHSQKKKVQFLNLYEHRKLKLAEQRLLQQKQQNQMKFKQNIRQRTKSMKLNQQIRSLLLRNELEQTISQICSRNRLQKHKHRKNLELRREKQLAMARNSFTRIKAGEVELHEKMKRINQMQASMARTNYVRKLGEEVELVEHLDKMLQGVCAGEFCDDCLEHNDPTFITEKT